MNANNQLTKGFCVYIDSVVEGSIPLVRDENGMACVFATEREAQREIADHQISRLQEFIDGQREFEDAMEVQEYVVPVEVLPDGSVVNELESCGDNSIIVTDCSGVHVARDHS